MIPNRLWKIGPAGGHHPGIFLDKEPKQFPVRVVLCTHRGSEVDALDRAEMFAPVPPLSVGTRIDFQSIITLDPANVFGPSGEFRYLGQITPEALDVVVRTYWEKQTLGYI